MRTAAHFGIPSGNVVEGWRKVYDRKGFLGLHKQAGKRTDTAMTKKKATKKETSSEDLAAQKLAKLQKEVEYLRAENAFLKKLDALVREEEAAKAQSRQQKPSGN